MSFPAQVANFAPRAAVPRIVVGVLIFFLLLSLWKVGYDPAQYEEWMTAHEGSSSFQGATETQLEIPKTSLAPAIETTGSIHVESPFDTEQKSQRILNEADAENLCQLNAFKVHPNRELRKVYDLFLAGTELDMLEIRLNELNVQVDYFVIVESTKTFTFQPKPLYFRDNFHRFEKFAHKIIYRVIDMEGMENNSTWEREKYQRDALFKAVFPGLLGEQAANQGDVIIVSDLDEVPRPDTVKILRNCEFPERVRIRSAFYYYSFQWAKHGNDWDHPQATFYKGLEDTIQPENLRMSFSSVDLVNASWHCSSCFSTVAEMQKKIESFSHTEFNHPRFKDPPQVVRRVRHGLDLFDRAGQEYDRVDNNPDLPSFLKENVAKFPWLVNRDALNANFIDYFGVEGRIEDMSPEKRSISRLVERMRLLRRRRSHTPPSGKMT